MWWLWVACASDPAVPTAGLDDDGVESTVVHEYPTPYRDRGGDVVLIVLDTLRADRLSQWGYALDTSPGLAKLAARSVRFSQAWAPAPWTVPSTTSILTGQHPLRHQLRRPGDVLPEAVVTLPEHLRDAGWRTAAWSYNVSIAPKHRHDQGFDAFTSNTGKVLGYPHAGRMTTAAGAWLVGSPTPSFLYLQPMNCHGPYKVPKAHRDALLGQAPTEGFAYYKGPMQRILKGGRLAARDKVTDLYLQSLREQYDTAVRYETDRIGELVDALDAAGRLDGALVIVTADHGEELFEHGGFSHGYSLHREVLHVPLLVKFPGQTEAWVVDEPVSTVDVTPTVLDVLGLPVPTGDGRSLRPYATAGATLPLRPLLFDVFWPKRIVAQAVLVGTEKYVHINHDYQGREDLEELYDLAADPAELDDVSGVRQTRLFELRTLTEALAAELTGTAAPENVLTDMDRSQLEALGYLE